MGSNRNFLGLTQYDIISIRLYGVFPSIYPFAYVTGTGGFLNLLLKFPTPWSF
jgi:hypothetical protein